MILNKMRTMNNNSLLIKGSDHIFICMNNQLLSLLNNTKINLIGKSWPIPLIMAKKLKISSILYDGKVRT